MTRPTPKTCHMCDEDGPCCVHMPTTVDVTPVCARCGNALPATARDDARTCSTRCRVAHHRATRRAAADSYVVTDEDRAAIARVMSVPTTGVPGLGPPLSPEAQHALAHRVRP